MTADALSSQAFDILAMTNPVTAMLSLANHLFDIQGKLNSYVASLDQNIEKLKQDLRLLQNFVSETQGLFSNSLTNFKIAMQGVTVLGKLIVNNNGTYRFPKGMDKSWFTEKKKSETLQNDQLTEEQLEAFLKDGGQLMVYKDRAKVKMASQNDLASNVSFSDADVVIWYIVKDGVVINIAEHPEFKDLYKYLQKKGDKLKKDQYKTVSFNQAEKMTVDSMDGLEGRIARFEYYFRPAESAIAGFVAGVTTAKAIQATGRIPDGSKGSLKETKITSEFRGVASAKDVKKVVNITDGHFTEQSVKDIAKLAGNNSKANTTTLGKWDPGKKSYEQVAYADKNAYYDLGNEGWEAAENALRNAGITDENVIRSEMWRINQQYLDDRIKAGNMFEFTTNPLDLPENSYGKMEAQHLSDNGYKVIRDGNIWRMIK